MRRKESGHQDVGVEHDPHRAFRRARAALIPATADTTALAHPRKRYGGGVRLRTALDTQQIERYRQRGFLRLDGFLSADELAELTDAVTGGVEELGGAKLAGVDLLPGRWSATPPGAGTTACSCSA